MNTTIITKSDLISAIAYWGIRQSPYTFPSNLEAALAALEKRIDEKGIFESKEKGFFGAMQGIKNNKLDELITDLINNTPEIAIWNVTKLEQDNGITDPNDKKRTINLAGASRYGKMQAADNDFIDLYALCRNVCDMVTDEGGKGLVDNLNDEHEQK